jgi:DNA-binding SARP family transcriptional activator
LRLRTFGGLWIEHPEPGAGVTPRPRAMALLAILAAAGPKGTSRDRAIGVLWPETDEERARHALSQTLYSLRRDLGAEVVLTSPVLRLDPDRIGTDLGDFRDAVAARRWADVAEVYAGPFLDQFHLTDAPEFERWLETERASLATEAIRAIEIAARASAEGGRLEEAAEYWRRLTRLDPVDSRIAASYMEALAVLGDGSAAIAHGRAHVELVRRELEVEPDPVVGHVVARLREAPHHRPGPVDRDNGGSPARRVRLPPAATDTGFARNDDQDEPTPDDGAAAAAADSAHDALSHEPAAESTGATHATGQCAPLGVRAVMAASVAGIALIAALGWRSASSADEAAGDARPVLAVGRIRDLAVTDSVALDAVSRDMLATSLGRLGGVQVITSSRMLELAPRDADTSRTAFTDAARRAGATEIVEGELNRLAGGLFRFDARRVDVERGLVRRGYRVSGSDRIALVDSVTALIAADLGVGTPAGSLGDLSTRSPVAYRFYEEGLRALYRYDAYAASRLFRSAVREDSTFPMATYYAWRTGKATAEPDEATLADRAVALAARAPRRERLLIMTHVGAERSDVRALAAAETLATEYPRDPEALVRAAEVVVGIGRAVELLDRAISIDSAASPHSAALCRMCEALSELTTRYRWADSGAAVERTLSRWRALRPNDATPWALEADRLVGLGRRADAEAAVRRYDALGGTRTSVHLGNLITALRLDELDEADRYCDEGLAPSNGTEPAQYRWYCTIKLRMQGRYREALALAREGRVPKNGLVRRGLTPDPYQAAIAQMEMGLGGAAADGFIALAREMDGAEDVSEGAHARQTAWLLTLSATAAVAGGDTARARGLVDSIEVVGRRSLFARDPLLHRFVRGLLHSRAGEHDAALRELRLAMHSPTFGYTRINYELAELLLKLGRPAEAIPVVQAALRGGIEGSGLYVTRTELHELVARLFDASAQRDSAAAHYAVVERAWQRADPTVAKRYESARRWLRAWNPAAPLESR